MSTNLNPEALRTKTLPQLRQMCKDQGLKASGNKAQLIEKLTGATIEAANDPPTSGKTDEAVGPAFQTPKKKRKSQRVDVRGIDELESPDNVSSSTTRVQAFFVQENNSSACTSFKATTKLRPH